LADGGWPRRHEAVGASISAGSCRVASRKTPDRRAMLVSAPTLDQLALSAAWRAIGGARRRPDSWLRHVLQGSDGIWEFWPMWLLIFLVKNRLPFTKSQFICVRFILSMLSSLPILLCLGFESIMHRNMQPLLIPWLSIWWSIKYVPFRPLHG
jgi:hypothetical protein